MPMPMIHYKRLMLVTHENIEAAARMARETGMVLMTNGLHAYLGRTVPAGFAKIVVRDQKH